MNGGTAVVWFDIGKYSAEFQKRLRGGAKVDHATAGAQELYRNKNVMQAYCVAGHHSGLPDGGSPAEPATFYGRMKKDLKDYQAFKEEIEIPAFPALPLKPIGRGGFSAAFFYPYALFLSGRCRLSGYGAFYEAGEQYQRKL